MSREVYIKGPVLLLMGPIGLFFSRLARHLDSQGVEVYKICFPLREPGFRRNQCIRFNGEFNGDSSSDFKTFLSDVVTSKRIRHIFMYGDFIWPHQQAIELAYELKAHGLDIEAWVFELGYLRPNYITLEQNRVNCRSNLNKSVGFYQALQAVKEITEAPKLVDLRWRKVWKAPTFVRHAFTNYQICAGAHKLQPKPSYVTAQVLGFFRKYLYLITEREVKARLLNGDPFFLAVLQVSTDSQLKHGSPFNSVENFIEHVIDSFARHANPEQRLFIKHHPRDRGYTNYSAFIQKKVKEHNLERRIEYFHDYPLGSLFQTGACQGCILINSSVGFQTLFHHIPLKVLGTAPYNLTGLSDQQSLSLFWKNPEVPDPELVKKFYQYTLDTTQIYGNFDGYFPFEQTFRIPISSTRKAHDNSHDLSVDLPRICLFDRLKMLALAYGHYFLHWVAHLIGARRTGQSLFERSAALCLKAMGAKVVMERTQTPRSVARPEIHIGNHESALDVLLVHGCFRMPAATTAQLHLRFLLPGFNVAAQRYGHLLLDYRCSKSRTRTLLKSLKTLRHRRRLFIFPSGSLKTPIQERFSRSVAFLARQSDATIHPWLISYRFVQSQGKIGSYTDPLSFLRERLTGHPILIVCREQPVVDPRQYLSDEDMTQALQLIYKSVPTLMTAQAKNMA